MIPLDLIECLPEAHIKFETIEIKKLEMLVLKGDEYSVVSVINASLQEIFVQLPYEDTVTDYHSMFSFQSMNRNQMLIVSFDRLVHS